MVLTLSKLGNNGASQVNDEGTLREKAREVFQAGKLPNRRPDRTWGGPGVGADCTICRVPVQRDEPCPRPVLRGMGVRTGDLFRRRVVIGDPGPMAAGSPESRWPLPVLTATINDR
jgi:hypothetical protein